MYNMSETKNSHVGYKVSKTHLTHALSGKSAHKLWFWDYHSAEFVTLIPGTLSGLVLYISTLFTMRKAFFPHFTVLCFGTAFLKGEKSKEAFTFPRTKEEFVLWGGNVTFSLTLSLWQILLVSQRVTLQKQHSILIRFTIHTLSLFPVMCGYFSHSYLCIWDRSMNFHARRVTLPAITPLCLQKRVGNLTWISLVLPIVLFHCFVFSR